MSEGNRAALLICAQTFEDQAFRKLSSPLADVRRLKQVLQDPAIGAFAVEELIDRPSHEVRRHVEAFYQDRSPNDLLLLYLSGHGHRDDHGRLYFICSDTELSKLRSSALPAGFISDIAQESRSRRQVLIIDSCFSGAFAKGMMTKAGGQHISGDDVLSGGRGQVVLTASTAFQYSLEGTHLEGEAQPSVFTKHLIEGLRTGEADLNNDAVVDIDELYRYVHDKTVAESKQVPQRWTFQSEGVIRISNNPAPRNEAIPAAISELLIHQHPGVRLQGVEDLAQLLASSRRGLVLAAMEALRKLRDEDEARRVRDRALEVLSQVDANPHPRASSVPSPPVASEKSESLAHAPKDEPRQPPSTGRLKVNPFDAESSGTALPERSDRLMHPVAWWLLGTVVVTIILVATASESPKYSEPAPAAIPDSTAADAQARGVSVGQHVSDLYDSNVSDQRARENSGSR